MMLVQDGLSFDDPNHIFPRSGESSRSGSNSATDRPSGFGIMHKKRSHSGIAKHRDEKPDLQESNGEDDGKPKKQKFTRSRTACLQCRSRKSKCGAQPPEPCPNCIEAHLPCQWPIEDGRSSRARLQRAKSISGGRTAYEPSEYDGQSVDDVGMGTKQHHDDGWLDRLLAGDMPTPAASNASNTVVYQHQAAFDPTASIYPNMTANPLNHSVPGPSQAFYTPQAAPSTSDQTLGLQPPSFSQMAFSPSSVDPAQFVWAVSSRLPTVEESSPNDERSSMSNPSPSMLDPNMSRPPRRKKGAAAPNEDGKIVKVTWWRPHGQTAITPGLKRITLKVRVDSPHERWRNASPRSTLQGSADVAQEVISPDGMPSLPIMRHLLDVFMVHFGCQFPFLVRQALDAKIEARTGSVFLLNAIAGIAARFSTHPAIALPGLEPHAYGNIFCSRAKALLGSMLAVPSRDTVVAFILLAHTGFANDSESEVWMMTGLAVRMALDLGLHINPPEESNISAEDRRLNRLVFWSVVLMDFALSFGVGRSTTFRVEDITQKLPTEDDIHPDGSFSKGSGPLDTPRSPFPYAAKQMLSYYPLVNMLNRQVEDTVNKGEGEIQAARALSIKEYNHLPQDMQWNVGNLQRHCRANQGSIFLHLHLWMHTVLASGYLTGSNLLRRSAQAPMAPGAGLKSGAATPNSATASVLWRNSARTIGDILVLSDIINPYSYFALPFVNQAFFVAGCCYVKEIEQTRSTPNTPVGSPRRIPASLTMTSNINKSESEEKDPRQVDLSRALLTSVAATNISTLQQGLAKQNTYWSGIAWIASALGQRIEGVKEVDMVDVTEKLASFVSLPDAGLVGRQAEGNDGDGPHEVLGRHGTATPKGLTPNGWGGLGSITPAEGAGAAFDFGNFDFMSLPFDLGTMEGSHNVIEQEVPLPQHLASDWFR